MTPEHWEMQGIVKRLEELESLVLALVFGGKDKQPEPPAKAPAPVDAGHAPGSSIPVNVTSSGAADVTITSSPGSSPPEPAAE